MARARGCIQRISRVSSQWVNSFLFGFVALTLPLGAPARFRPTPIEEFYVKTLLASAINPNSAHLHRTR